jgi:hypothetical protein
MYTLSAGREEEAGRPKTTWMTGVRSAMDRSEYQGGGGKTE